MRRHSIDIRPTAWRLAGLSALFLAGACVANPPRDAGAPIDAGEAARGLAYAQDACASCHAVAAGDMQSPNPAAPAFQAVADTPGMTGLALRVWLQSEHESMPAFIVEPERVDDLWAYMATLERDD
jgi:mono/diheme cytochrome c family protein